MSAVRIVTAFLLACALVPTVRAQNNRIFDIGPETATVQKVVADLAKTSGSKLEVAGTLQREVLFLRAKAVSLSDVMARIAASTDAEWVQDGDVYRLTRSGLTVANQEKKEFQERLERLGRARDKRAAEDAKRARWTDASAESLAKELVDLLARIQKQGMKSEDDSHIRNLAGALPIDRTIAAVVNSVSLNDIASIPPDGRRVFATDPKPSQVAIPSRALPYLNEGVRRHTLFANAVARMPGHEDLLGSSYNGLTVPAAVVDDKATLGRALLSVQRTGDGDQFECTLNIVDSNGKQILLGRSSIYVDTDPVDVFKINVDADKNTPVTLSPATAEIIKAYVRTNGQIGSYQNNSVSTSLPDGSTVELRGNSPESKAVVLSPEATQVVLDPVSNDPLGIAVGEPLALISDRLNTNVVALIPDSAFVGAATVFAVGSATPSQFLAETTRSMHMGASQEGGWLTFKPSEPAKERLQAINRTSLGKLLVSMKKDSYVSLEDFSQFLLTQEHIPDNASFDGAWMGMINSLETDGLVNGLHFRVHLFRLYGSLSPSQRIALTQSPMKLSSLTKQQSNYLGRFIDGMWVGLQFEAGSETQFPSNLSQDKSEVMPTGLPADGTLMFVVKSQQGLLGFDDASKQKRFLSASDIAALRIQNELPNLRSFLGAPPQFQRYRLAAQTLTDVNIRLQPKVLVTCQLKDAKVVAEQRDLSYDDFPDSLKKAIDAIVSVLRENLKGIGETEQSNPPPIPHR